MGDEFIDDDVRLAVQLARTRPQGVQRGGCRLALGQEAHDQPFRNASATSQAGRWEMPRPLCVASSINSRSSRPQARASCMFDSAFPAACRSEQQSL